MFKGIPASPGIVYGKAHLITEEEYCIVKRTLSKKEIKDELVRFNAAVQVIKNELESTHKRVVDELGKKHARLFDAYLLILEDTLFTDDVVAMIKTGVNAEYALQEMLAHVSQTFSHINDPYLRERERDIIDVVKKIIHQLLGKDKKNLEHFEEPVIIIAHNLSPSDTIAMDNKHVLGFATDIGGKTSHIAILAQSLELPAVVGMHDITAHIKTGDHVILDGYQGGIIVNPTDEMLAYYLEEKKRIEEHGKKLEELHDLPAITTDGRTIELFANIEAADEVKSVLLHGGNGIGLYRTEYLYLNRSDLPTEDEQYQSYVSVARRMKPHPVIIRTVDLGGDKLADQLGTEQERNPFLGLRAIRLCLKYPELFKTQLRAILRASVEQNLSIMYPMISGVEELRQANVILQEVQAELRSKHIAFNEHIKIGIMIELPSAAYTADILAQEADFVSIGTNDLIQYTFAVDRINESVSHLYQPLHPAIVRTLKFVIDACNKAGKPVGICGEMGSDHRIAKVLIGLGFHELSMPAMVIPKMKETIRSFSYEEAQRFTNTILNARDMNEVQSILTST